MEAAKRAGVVGIQAICGGSCICATCHCWAEDPSAANLPPQDSMEADTLEFEGVDIRPTSRLSCQITITAEQEGLVLHVAGTE